MQKIPNCLEHDASDFFCQFTWVFGTIRKTTFMDADYGPHPSFSRRSRRIADFAGRIAGNQGGLGRIVNVNGLFPEQSGMCGDQNSNTDVLFQRFSAQKPRQC
jgi:hypothetical protein